VEIKKFNQKEYFNLIAQSAEKFRESSEYKKVIDELFGCYKKRGTIFTMGCGGSASTATHFASDLAKTTIVENKPRFKAMALVDNIPLVSAWTNDSGWGTVFVEQLEPWLTKDDILVGFSVHGGSGDGDAGPWSQNLIAAMKLANERGATIIGFSGFDGGTMKKIADSCLVVPIGYEPYGTPVVEAMHVVLHHGIIFDLKKRIANE
jgi:D-sedoheptulose 7-phosphate isomerase